MDQQRVFDVELEELKEIILNMGLKVQKLIRQSVNALEQNNRALAEQVIGEDDEVDQAELKINEKCVELIALRQPEASDLRFLMSAMRIVTDLERIGDLAEDIAERSIELAGQQLLKPLIDIPKMAVLAQTAVALVLEAFINRDADKARLVWEKEQEVDQLRDRIHDELLDIMQKDSKTVTRAIPLLLISRHLERIVDHTTNIGEEVVYMVDAKVVKHGGL